MSFGYYIDEGIDRLFRFDDRTGQQDRWNDAPGTWANVAPWLADEIYSGKVGLDEVTAEFAERDYPRAFEDSPIPTEVGTNRYRAPAAKSPLEELPSNDAAEPHPPHEFGTQVFLTEDTMNRIQVAIAQNTSVDEVIAVNEITGPEQIAVKKFYADLQKEISETKLQPGQYWAVPSDWV